MNVPVFFFPIPLCVYFLLGNDRSLSLSLGILKLNIDGLELAEEEPQMLRVVLRRWQVWPQARSTERVGKY
jgi:hypothetical protein